MDSIFILNPFATALNLKDAIDERLIKARAIANCLLSQDDNHYEPSKGALHGAVWAIDDYLDEVEHLENRLKEREK